MKTPAHKLKMQKRRAEQYARKSRIDQKQVDRFCTYWKHINARNGLSGPKARLRNAEHEAAKIRNAVNL